MAEKPKKELANLQLKHEYNKSREKLAKKIAGLLKEIDTEQTRLEDLKDVYYVNYLNRRLLNSKLKRFSGLKKTIKDSWDITLKN
jgi:hypothetical protein